jgi:hypothetical protein
VGIEKWKTIRRTKDGKDQQGVRSIGANHSAECRITDGVKINLGNHLKNNNETGKDFEQYI